MSGGAEYRFPLSYPQLRLWFLEQLNPGDPAYHMPIALGLGGPLDTVALDRAFQTIIDRHEVLRTGLRATEGEPEQSVLEHVAFHLAEADFSGLPDPGAALAQAAAALVSRPFELTHAPLLRATLARLGPQQHTLIVVIHHLVCDGWSVGVLAAELSEAYAAHLEGRAAVLPELPVQYGDFALWQRAALEGPALDEVVTHWAKALDGATLALDVPTDRSRLAPGGSAAGHVLRPLEPDLVARIDALAPSSGASRFMVVLAAYGAVLGKLAGTTDPVIGTPTAGRAAAETRPLIGCFIDMLPLRLDQSGDPDAARLLRRVRAASLAAFARQELPFERLVEHLRPPRGLPRTPLFQAMLTFQDTPQDGVRLPGLTVTAPHTVRSAVAKYEFTLNVEQPGGGLELDLEFDRGLFDPATADLVIDGTVTALRWLAGAGAEPLSRALASLPDPATGPEYIDVNGYRVLAAELGTGTGLVPPPAATRTEPADDREAALLGLFRRTLRNTAFTMADDYFEHGGSSLRAVRLLAEIEGELGTTLRMREFFQAATPLGVMALIRQEESPASSAQSAQDAILPDDIVPAPIHPLAWDPPHVLLTGATGFLGHALLERLAASRPETVISCLIRARDDAHAAERLAAASARFHSRLPAGPRIRAVAGDIAEPRLGLDPVVYGRLADGVAAVYHCAAEVSFALPYAALRPANVLGTREVLRFAADRVGKAVFYLSTLGQAGTDGHALPERPLPPERAASTGYVAGKRVAEALVAQAAERGLPTVILRCGLATAHSATGAMGEHDQLALGLRGALHTGLLPDLPDLPVHVMPADETAAAIVELCSAPAAAGRVVHLYNPEQPRLSDVARVLGELGRPTRFVPVETWAATLLESGLPPAARLLVRLFAEGADRSVPRVEAAAAAEILGRPPTYSGLTADYLGRAVAYVLTGPQAQDGATP